MSTNQPTDGQSESRFSKSARVVMGVLFAASVAGILATALPGMNERAQTNTLASARAGALVAHCGAPSTQSVIRTAQVQSAGIDATRALGVIIRHPDRLRQVCDIVDQALADTQLEQAKPGQAKTNNEELYALADSLGIDNTLAQQIVVRANDAKTMKSIVDLTVPAAPSAPLVEEAPAIAPAAGPSM